MTPEEWASREQWLIERHHVKLPTEAEYQAWQARLARLGRRYKSVAIVERDGEVAIE